MSAIVPFNFGDVPVRIEDRDGAPWFVLSDVCRVLDISNVGNAAARLDDDEKDDIRIPDATGRDQLTIAVNESGLYSLVLRSRKESAKRFRKWVTSEVLPTIRRTGGFGMPAAPILDDATLRALLLGKIDEVQDLRSENDHLAAKAHTLDRLTNADGAVAPTHAAKLLGVKPGRLFDWLEANRWLYRGADGLVGYQVKVDAGYIVHRAHRLDKGRRAPRFVNHALITPKGIARLTELAAGRA